MEIFMVGGAVRDVLLGLPVQDRDWVVVGSTPEELTRLGYLPVGRDFPVFLHPDTREEYALARTERKTAPGYRGFAVHAAPDVTLQEDLARRDLTINSIAASLRADCRGAIFCSDFETLVDPHGGQADLKAKVLRHVTGAFREDPVRILRLARFAARFADFSVAPETTQLMQDMVADPVRILRLARFAARFADFSVAPETTQLMQDMVAEGQTDALVPERVWQELSRGLMEAKPSRMFGVLRSSGALERVLPEVNKLWGVPQRADYHPEVDTGVHLMMV
ncbi:MAG: hypothetical protein EAZ34_00770, partial [Polaromonas sp.]